ncbi:MAG: PASTA domain-containing protein [Actinobacteria bacterium]|nr:PASTA domain-containing protein [Actinomycetota bacterium]
MPGSHELDLPRRRPLSGYLVFAAIAVVLASAAIAFLVSTTGSSEVTTPSLLGSTLAEAVAQAEGAGLGLAAAEGSDDPEIVVVSQEPGPGTVVRRGTVIRVALAGPPPNVLVPSLLGLTPEEARAALQSAALRLGAVRSDPDPGGTPGSVTRQEPQVGSELPSGASVHVWVAAAATSTVPDLSGMTKAEAESAAATADLTIRFLGEVTDEVLPGLVFRQSPRAGARMAPGSSIVAVINGPSSGAADPGANGEAQGASPPPVFQVLVSTYTFPVLYPTVIPDGLAPVTGGDNPAHRASPAGGQGFEMVYVDSARPEVSFSLMQGDWFDPGLDQATTVDVNGRPGSLGVSGRSVVVVWTASETTYAVSALGLEEAEVLAIAAGLRPMPVP